ncbi:MAG: hypothetical protein ACUVWY_13770 [Desulfosoma sp.]|uniref:hypothetical protein n=1 Tax=Desulfosoma sp. TaxID=2603217 RepID=UPI00404AD813
MKVWHQWGRLEERAPQWENPWAFQWPQDLSEAESFLKALETEISPSLWQRLLMGCLAAALGRSDEPEAQSFAGILERFVRRCDLGLSHHWLQQDQARWALVALPTAQGTGAKIVWALVGSIAGGTTFHLPTWLLNGLDASAWQALQRAHKLIWQKTGRGLAFFPLISPRSTRPFIQGPSWALSAYLGAWQAHRGPQGDRKPYSILATGDVDDQGKIVSVGSVRQKARAAARAGFNVLLCPYGCAEGIKSMGSLHLIEVADLQAAEYFWEISALETSVVWSKHLDRLRSPEEMSAGLYLLDPRIRRWSGFFDAYAQTVTKILQDTKRLERFCESMERLLADAATDVDWMQTLLNPITVTVVRNLADVSPLLSCRLAFLRWALAVQRGRVDEALAWTECYRNFSWERLAAYPEGIYRIADGLNRRFITEYHSRYRFNPELPRWLTEFRDYLEKTRETQAVVNGLKPAMPSLGKLYGTIAQNYGFCGPKYLDSCVQSVRQAWDAFGAGQVPDLSQEYLRQYHYLIYAHLDAQAPEKAREALEAYLSAPLDSIDPCSLKRYEHAALARFLAETGCVLSGYASWCRRQLGWSLDDHPWQLWLWNVGRWIESKEMKKRAWEQGIQLCWRLGLTARPMALLHAASLYGEGLASADFLEPVVESVLKELEKGCLCKEHFAHLLSKPSWQGVLLDVLEDPARWFPFTYR